HLAIAKLQQIGMQNRQKPTVVDTIPSMEVFPKWSPLGLKPFDQTPLRQQGRFIVLHHHFFSPRPLSHTRPKGCPALKDLWKSGWKFCLPGFDPGWSVTRDRSASL